MSIKYTEGAKALIVGIAIACTACMTGLAMAVFKNLDSSPGVKVHYMDESKDIEKLECSLRPINIAPHDEALEKLKAGRLSVFAECSKIK